MPLVKRKVNPVAVSRRPLDARIRHNELEAVAANSLAGVIRQLADLSRLCEDLFSELLWEAESINVRTNNLALRIGELRCHLGELDFDGEEAMNVESLFNVQHFSSQEKPSQQLFNADARPHIIKESFDEIDPPPSLERFNVFYGKGINCVVKYTNPGYFADLWVSGELQRQAMARRTKTKTNSERKAKSFSNFSKTWSKTDVRRIKTRTYASQGIELSSQQQSSPSPSSSTRNSKSADSGFHTGSDSDLPSLEDGKYRTLSVASGLKEKKKQRSFGGGGTLSRLFSRKKSHRNAAPKDRPALTGVFDSEPRPGSQPVSSKDTVVYEPISREKGAGPTDPPPPPPPPPPLPSQPQPSASEAVYAVPSDPASKGKESQDEINVAVAAVESAFAGIELSLYDQVESLTRLNSVKEERTSSKKESSPAGNRRPKHQETRSSPVQYAVVNKKKNLKGSPLAGRSDRQLAAAQRKVSEQPAAPVEYAVVTKKKKQRKASSQGSEDFPPPPPPVAQMISVNVDAYAVPQKKSSVSHRESCEIDETAPVSPPPLVAVVQQKQEYTRQRTQTVSVTSFSGGSLAHRASGSRASGSRSAGVGVNRIDLMAAIRHGKELRKVEHKGQSSAGSKKKTFGPSGFSALDVASILARRVAVEVDDDDPSGTSDLTGGANVSEDEWD
ncbi:actin-binding protein WASF1-like [Oscarella lobularis]|uniref:actin-binding protein WASF1-like n=1 Tax=Oscarella lobularis TaxID=121494 RepID=UPI003314419E